METLNAQIIKNFLIEARELMTCTTCGCRIIKEVCQCHNGHSVCYGCANVDRARCTICSTPIYTKKCLIVDNFADYLLEAEKLQTIERMAELLECNVCYDRIMPNLKLCVMGHAVCYSCWTQMIMCPICKSNFTHVTNKLLIELVCLFPCRCIYFEKGCQMMGFHSEVLNHQSKCEFREFNCRISKCIWKGESEITLTDHIKCTHKMAIRPSSTVKLILNIFKIQQNAPEYITNYITLKNKHFWQHFYCIAGRVQFVTLMLGSPDDAKDYKVVVNGNSITKCYNIFSEDHLDVDTCFNKQILIANDITSMITQKIVKSHSGELVVVYECKITIEKVKSHSRWQDLLGATILGGAVLFLLFKKTFK